jgi:C-terminal processing protease CtpA/Prc
MSISYNSQVGDGIYQIQFESDSYDDFKKVEDKIRELIDKRVNLKLLTEQYNTKVTVTETDISKVKLSE